MPTVPTRDCLAPSSADPISSPERAPFRGAITSENCPVCGVAFFRWRFEKKGRQFWSCCHCGLEKQHPLPSPEALQAYYDEAFVDGMYGTFTAAETMKTLTARQRLREIRGRVPFSGHWLDVGCANGVFVREAAAAGMEAEGVELSQVAVGQARLAGLTVHQGDIADLPADEAFDCITGFDVIEHVLDPKAFLRAIVDRLKPGGHVVLTLPDKASLFSRLMGPRWWFYIPEEHLHYFDQKLMRRLFEFAGLEVVRTGLTFKPLTFNYGLTQFIEYNPLIYRVMKTAALLVPHRLREWIAPLYIGEMKIIGRKPAGARLVAPDLPPGKRN